MTYPGVDIAGARLAARAPFHLEATVRVLQRRPVNRVEVWKEKHYLRVLASADDPVLVDVENRGTIDNPNVRFSIRWGNPSVGTSLALVRTVRKVLGLDVDPAPLQYLADSERALRPTALALRGMRPPRYADLYEAFVNVLPLPTIEP